jgi:hypothetical protein
MTVDAERAMEIETSTVTTLPTASRSAAAPLSRDARIFVACAVGLIAGTLAWTASAQPSDFDPLWFGAREIVRGVNPYPLVGPAGKFYNPWGLYYPAPALVIAIPFSLLPLPMARATFVAVSAGWFAFALSRRARWSLLALLSFAFISSVQSVQWAPLLCAAALTPALAGLIAAKPTVGVGLFLGMEDDRGWGWAVGGALVLLLVSLLLIPDWIPAWLHVVSRATHMSAPITRPGGVFLLLGLLRWRCPEARLFLGLACVPQTPSFYDALPLFLIPRTPVEMCALVVLTHVASLALRFGWHPEEFSGFVRTLGPLMIVFLYLPCLVMILRRPNVGPVPGWLERPGQRLRAVARRATGLWGT